MQVKYESKYLTRPSETIKYFFISSVSKYYLKMLRGWKKVIINLIWVYNMAVVAE